jgi:hypothetical protein
MTGKNNIGVSRGGVGQQNVTWSKTGEEHVMAGQDERRMSRGRGPNSLGACHDRAGRERSRSWRGGTAESMLWLGRTADEHLTVKQDRRGACHGRGRTAEVCHGGQDNRGMSWWGRIAECMSWLAKTLTVELNILQMKFKKEIFF